MIHKMSEQEEISNTILFTSFYRWKTWDLQRLSNVPEVTLKQCRVKTESDHLIKALFLSHNITVAQILFFQITTVTPWVQNSFNVSNYQVDHLNIGLFFCSVARLQTGKLLRKKRYKTGNISHVTFLFPLLLPFHFLPSKMCFPLLVDSLCLKVYISYVLWQF